IRTSSGFAGFMHEYARSLQFPQCHFCRMGSPHKAFRIVQAQLNTLIHFQRTFSEISNRALGSNSIDNADTRSCKV
ncbi:hypothetical protein VSR68_26175, partial [Paraburkholderia phymatum]|uniref:hypothetical protein n=1 Tax=Paraburkholderia phymatum TaxID=148447 RepID=UPI0031801211